MTKQINIITSKIDEYEFMLKTFIKHIYSMINTTYILKTNNTNNTINEQNIIDHDIELKQISELIIIPDNEHNHDHINDSLIKKNNIINTITDWNLIFDTVIDHHKLLINKEIYYNINNLFAIHSSNSINKFIQNIKQYTVIDPSVYVYAIILIHRFIKNNTFAITNMNKYCIFILSIMTASKLLEDMPYNNKSFEYCSCIPINNLNIYEIYFLVGLEFNTHINTDEYQIYQNCILDVYYNKACLVLDDKNICLYNKI